MAATAAPRLGLTPHFAHLDRTRVHVEGRDNSAEAPDEQVMHITRGYRRDHRPDLNPVMLALRVAHQAGMAMLMQPLSGHSSAAPEVGQMIRGHLAQLPITDAMTSLVAERALSREAHLQTLAQTPLHWITRVPVTVSEARAALVQADPQTMRPLVEGYRDQELASTDGGVEHRGVRIHSEHRPSQAQRTVATQLRTQSDQEVKAFKQRCGTAELDAMVLPPPELLRGDTGQSHAERGFRFLKAPPFFASSLYLKQPERIMALLRVMTVCWLGYTALEYRIRKALKDHGATFPDHKGQPPQNPTARWVFHSFVGLHVVLIPQQWPIVINLAEEHRNLLPLLGPRSAWFYR